MYGSIHRRENSKQQQQGREHKLRRHSDSKFVLLKARKDRRDTVNKMERNCGGFIFNNLPRVSMAYQVLSAQIGTKLAHLFMQKLRQR